MCIYVENKYQNLKIPLKMEDEIQNKGGIKELRCQKIANKIQNEKYSVIALEENI